MKKVSGVWLPDGDTHFEKMMRKAPLYMLSGVPVGVYQREKMMAALSHVKSYRTAVDIGAHVGFWSMWLGKFETLHAFEPSDSHADCWHENVKSGTLYRYALGAAPGFVGMDVNADNSGKSHISGAGLIQVKTLDSFGFTDVDFVKIDVEGYESAVIKGGAETLMRDKPIIIVESNGQHERYGLDDPVKTLQAMGAHVIEQMRSDFVMGW